MQKQGFHFWHNAQIVWQIGWSDFLLKYRGSLLGYLWSFADPLLRFIVILFIFRPFVGEHIQHYPLYLFLGIILWDYFVRTVTGCITMLHEKAMLIQKIPFPRILLILAVGWTNTIIFFTHLCIFFVFAIFYKVGVSTQIVFLPLLTLFFVLVSLGLGMLLSAFSLRFKDIPHLWQVAHQILFWLTPVFYPYEVTEPLLKQAVSVFDSLSSAFGWKFFELFIHFQPISIFLYDFRRALLFHDQGGISFAHICALLILSSICFGAGMLVFRWRSRYFVEEY